MNNYPVMETLFCGIIFAVAIVVALAGWDKGDEQ
jgi:hypothetical protein